jgi:tetratricopeptide (TPR) repeat protein
MFAVPSSYREESMNRISVIHLEAALLAAAALAAAPLLIRAQNLDEARVSIPTFLPAQTSQASAAPLEPVESPAENRADILLARGQYQAAVEAYEQAPLDSASVWNKMGIAYEMLLNNTAARRCYNKAHEIDPKNATVLNNIGSIEMSGQDYKRAEKLYRRAIKLNSQSALFHKNLGTAYISARKYKKGWEEYRAALVLDPQIFSTQAGLRVMNPTNAQDRGAMNYFMAKGCLMAGEKKQAIEYLRLALNEGYTSPKKLVEDTEFASLHSMPAFQEMIESETQSHLQAAR